jgi:hypothetical protein
MGMHHKYVLLALVAPICPQIQVVFLGEKQLCIPDTEV